MIDVREIRPGWAKKRRRFLEAHFEIALWNGERPPLDLKTVRDLEIRGIPVAVEAQDGRR